MLYGFPHQITENPCFADKIRVVNIAISNYQPVAAEE